MSTTAFATHVSMFQGLIMLEDISDRDFEILTLAEDCILNHQPRNAQEANAILEVLERRYGEPEDRLLHRALKSIIALIEDSKSDHHLAVA